MRIMTASGVAVLLGLALAGVAGSARGESSALNLGRYHALVIGNQQG
jgi:hypothetical protein